MIIVAQPEAAFIPAEFGRHEGSVDWEPIRSVQAELFPEFGILFAQPIGKQGLEALVLFLKRH